MSTPAQRRVTLAEVERQARADLAKGGPEVAIDWAFRHARAVARLAEAEQAWKSFDHDRYRLILDLGDKQLTRPEDYEALTYATASLHSAAADLGEARSVEVACSHVLRLAERGVGRQQQQQPAARPAQQQHKPRAA